MDSNSKRKYEELVRCINRIDKLYQGLIINQPGEDSFRSPKDVIHTFFRVCYEMKDNLKIDYIDLGKDIENICNSGDIALALDIANSLKHGKLDHRRTSYVIGNINTSITIFDPTGKPDNTTLCVDIDGNKIDCLVLMKNIMSQRDMFFKKHNILMS